MGGCLLFQVVVSSTSFLLLSNKKNESRLSCRSWGSRLNCRSWGSRMNSRSWGSRLNCRSWGSRMNCRSGASRISSPWLILPPSDDDDTANMNFYSLEDKKVGSIRGGSGVAVDHHTEIVGSSFGWLALYNEISGDLFLWNPVSRQRINLPRMKAQVDKVIVCDAGGGKWRVVLSLGKQGYKGLQLDFCCPRHSDGWTQFPTHRRADEEGRFRHMTYVDLAYSTKQNRLFCISHFGCVERWDLEDPSSPKIDGSNAEDPLKSRLDDMNTSYAVVAEHSNEVFIVERKLMIPTGGETSDRLYHYKTVDFDVYKLVGDGDNLRRLRTSSLNGLVMFVGNNHSVALPAAEFPELQTDSIYFTDDRSGGHDLGIYDYQNHSFSSCYYPNPNHVPATTRLTPAPFWFTPMSSNYF